MKIIRNRSFIFLHFLGILILIYIYYDFQSTTNIGLRNANRSIVHIILFIIIAVLGAYYIYTIFFKKIFKDFVRASLWLITIWIAFVNLLKGSDIWNILVHLGISILWVLVYHFGKNYLIDNNNAFPVLLGWMSFFFLFYVFSSFYAVYNINLVYKRIPVINFSYYVIVFFPWVSMITKKKIRRFFYFLILAVVLISFKRGAIIVFPLMIMGYIIIKSKIEGRRIAWFGKSMLIGISFVCGLIIVDFLAEGFLLNRFTPESLAIGSGRFELYRSAINNIVDRSFIDLLIGFGSGSSVKYLGTGVHNEWLEFLFSFGVIGVIFYTLFLFSLFFRLSKLIKENSKYSHTYMSAIIYILTVGLYGGFYFVHSTLYLMVFFGVVEGFIIKNKMLKSKN